MDLNKKYLKYVILPAKRPASFLQRYYELAYKCWTDVWLEAFKELEGTNFLYSDDFTRQDEIGALFYKDQCIGMSFFHRVDMSTPWGAADSYFKVWSPGAIGKIIEYGPDILVCSNFTIHQNFRRQVTNISTKDLLLAMIVKHFKSTDVNAMTGTVRNNKGMNECTYRHGALPLQRDVLHHGVAVDLVGFFHHAVKECDLPLVAEFSKAAWNNGFIEERNVGSSVNFPQAA